MAAEMVEVPPGTQRTPIHQRLNMVEWWNLQHGSKGIDDEK